MRKVFGFLGVALAAAVLLAAQPARALDIALDGYLRAQCGTASATAGAATLANKCGKVTSEALVTAAGAVYTLTVTTTGANMEATDICLSSVAFGTSSAGTPAISRTQVAANSLVVTVQNIHAANAFNGTIVVNYFCLKP